jgi:hypothetical protein
MVLHAQGPIITMGGAELPGAQLLGAFASAAGCCRATTKGESAQSVAGKATEAASRRGRA